MHQGQSLHKNDNQLSVGLWAEKNEYKIKLKARGVSQNPGEEADDRREEIRCKGRSITDCKKKQKCRTP